MIASVLSQFLWILWLHSFCLHEKHRTARFQLLIVAIWSGIDQVWNPVLGNMGSGADAILGI